MKKKQTAAGGIALVLLLALCLTAGAAAAEPAGGATPEIRVDGVTVAFPDAQPFLDRNGRTMVPLRYLGSALGAETGWDPETRTASVALGSYRLETEIGSRTLTLTAGTQRKTVEMDTESVIFRDRTYLPLRFIAEAFGADVDWSARYGCAGVWTAAAAPQEFAELYALAPTAPEGAVSRACAAETLEAEPMALLYGDQALLQSFADRREHLYRTCAVTGTHVFPALGLTRTGLDAEALLWLTAEEAASELAMDSPRLTVRFRTGAGLVYQADCMDRLYASVRGVAEITVKSAPKELTAEEIAFLCTLGVSRVQEGETLCIPADIHMNLRPDGAVEMHSIAPLSAA